MEFICVDNQDHEKELTIGKTYTGNYSKNPRFIDIEVCDDGFAGYYKKSRFEEVRK